MSEQLLDRAIAIYIVPREDGGLRVFSHEVPGLVLSHSDQFLVLSDIGPALIELLRHKSAALIERQPEEPQDDR